MAKDNNLPSLEDFYEEDLLEGLGEETEEGNEDPPKPPEEEDEEEALTPPEEDDEEEEEDPLEEEPVSKKKKKKEEEEESEDDDDEEEGEDPEPEGVFWEDVEKITGSKIEVDYNGVDPETPEGAALRERAVADNAVSSFVEEMKTKMPKVYRVFEHALAGGTPEDLYKPGEKDYSSIEIKEGDEEHARSIIQEYYQKRGLASSKIAKLIDIDEDSEEGLLGTAKEYLKQLSTAQEKERNELAELQKQRDLEQKTKDQKFLTAIDSTLKKGKIGSFVLPKKEGDEFYEFIKGRIQRDGRGGYVAVTPLEDSEIEKQLQYEYFRFKKGDLDKLITDKAKSAHTRKLKRAITKNSGKVKSGEAPVPKKGSRTLRDYEEN